jgi:hypothetical protein
MTSGQGDNTYRFALLWHYYGVPEGMVLWDFMDLAAVWEGGSSTKAWPADVFGSAFRYADRKSNDQNTSYSISFLLGFLLLLHRETYVRSGDDSVSRDVSVT